MQVGVFLFGAVPMPDAGAGDPQPTSRRTTNEAVWHTTERLIDVGVLADELGFDYYFLTEHHFQHEGYEVIPNAVMVGAVVAERTERIKIGALVHVLPQWHPLRFAEDFATLHNLSRGRAVLALGRGTVPREAIPLGTVIGSTDDPAQRAAQDAVNRAKFAEAVEIVDRALNNERFSFHGDHYDVPPPGIPDRGSVTEELTLLPRPLYPYEEWQTVSSRETLETVARRGVGAVWWNLAPDLLQADWDRFAEVWEVEHGTALAPGDRRMVVLNVRVGDTTEAAMAGARPGWDEHWKFLGPYGRLEGIRRADGSPLAPGQVPTLEEGMAQGLALVGTADEVADQIAARLGPLAADRFTIYPLCLGDPYESYEDQLHRLATDVLPKLR